METPANSFPTQLLLRPLLTLAFPMVLTQCSMALMQFADAWMVGGLGSAALAAITPAGMLILVLSTFGTGFLTCISTFVGQSFGQNNHSGCSSYAWQGVWIACILGIATLAFLPTAQYVFGFFNHEFEVFQMEVSYFRISIWAIFPQLIAAAVGNYFIGIHRPGIAMFGMLSATALNFVFNFGFIYGHMGFPKLGFAGAAWGTVAASVVHAVTMLAFILKNCKIQPASKSRIKEMTTIGLPAAVQDALDVISWGLIIIFLVGQFGKEHLAAATILIRCMQMSFLPSDGVGSALMAMVAKSIGAGRLQRAKWESMIGLRVIGTYMGTMAILFFVFRYQILGLFTDDPEVIRIGAQAMICVSFFQIFDALSVVYVHCLQGAGDARWPSAVNLILCLTILLGGGFLTIRLFPELQSFGVWLVSTAYICTQGIIFALRWKKGKWTKISIFQNNITII